MHLSSVGLFKGQVSLAIRKNWLCFTRNETKFIDSQNFYFHSHYKLFCIKAVPLSDKLSLNCRRLWPIENKCIGIYGLKTSFERVAHLGKSCVNATQFQRLFRKNKEEMN